MKKLYVLFFSFCALTASAQWTPISGVNGNIYDIVVSGSRLLVTNGSMYASTDGQTFTASGTGLSGGSCRALIDFNGTPWAGTSGSDIFSSADNGVNWVREGGRNGLTTVRTTSVYVEGNNILYGTDGNGGSHYSTNGGNSFSGSSYPSGGGVNKTVGKNIVKLGNDLFSCSLQNVFKSTDGGINWTTITTAPAIASTSTSLCVVNGGLLLSIYGGGVYRSMDAGTSWTQVLGGGLGTPANNITRVYYSNGVAFAGGALSQLHQSNDNGATWTDISGTGIGVGEVVQSVCVFDGHLYLGTNTGFYRKPFSATGIAPMRRMQMKVYPIPARDIIYLDGLNEGSKISILSMTGQTVLKTELDENSSINIETLPAGSYILMCEQKVARIVKN